MSIFDRTSPRPAGRTARSPQASPWRRVFLLGLMPLLVGLLLVIPAGATNVITDVGSALIGGSFIGLIFALVQYTMDQRNQQQDKDADLRLLLNSTHDLPGIDLNGRSLTRAYLRGKNLTAARLDGADLTKVDLQATVLDGAVLTNARLTRATLNGASAKGADLAGCWLQNADLRGADLEKASLRGALMNQADLSRARLVDADLSRGSLCDANLQHADLTGAQLIGVHAQGARLARADLRRSSLVLGDFTSAHLSRARLNGADLTGAKLGEAMLIRAELTGAVFQGCSLAGANLTASNLAGAVLTSADLSRAVMVGCDLRGADLTGAQLTGVQGLGSARTDAHTRWPREWARGAKTDASTAKPASGRPPAVGCRRLVVIGNGTAESHAGALVDELKEQQKLATARRQENKVSLPLGARAPRDLRSSREGIAARLHLAGTARLRIAVDGAIGSRALRATLHVRGQSIALPAVSLDQRPPDVPGEASHPDATEELAARTLDLLDPRDGAPWQARAHAIRAMRAWEARGDAVTPPQCRRELLAAVAVDPLSPVVNYALGALAYNMYEEMPMRRAIEYFAVAHASSGRLPPAMAGLVGLSLSGMALSNSQLYHRFGVETPEVLAVGRTAAVMAVDTTRERLNRRGDSPVVRRNAMEGYALARYSEAFSQHVTEVPDHVKASISMYEDAIKTLETAERPVPAVLFNNLGYQHMTLAGRHEPGPDVERYRIARGHFVSARELNPDLFFAWTNLGNVDRLLGNPQAAEASCRQALKITPTYPQGWNELARVLLDLGRSDEAEQSHGSALACTSSGPVRAQLRAEYGEGLVLVGRPDDAIAAAEQGLAEDPDNRYCLATLAEARAGCAGRPEDLRGRLPALWHHIEGRILPFFLRTRPGGRGEAIVT